MFNMFGPSNRDMLRLVMDVETIIQLLLAKGIATEDDFQATRLQVIDMLAAKWAESMPNGDNRFRELLNDPPAEPTPSQGVNLDEFLTVFGKK